MSSAATSLFPAAAIGPLHPTHAHIPKGKPSLTPDSPAMKKLRQAAGEFESMLLSNLWKSMKSTFADSDDSDDPAHETLNDMGIQAMSSAVGKAGGLGLANLIIKDLAPKLAIAHHPTAPNNGKASTLPADNFLKSR